MQEISVFLFDVETIIALARLQAQAEGKDVSQAFETNMAIPNDLRILGNHTPLIVASPKENAQVFARAFSSSFRNAPIETSWLLHSDLEDVMEKGEEIWRSLGPEVTRTYKFAIFFVEP